MTNMTIGHDKNVLQNNEVCEQHNFCFYIRQNCAKFAYKIKNNSHFILAGTFFVLDFIKQTH